MFPGDEMFFIMGSDSFADFSSWKNYSAIFSCCNIVTITRPGARVSLLQALPVDIAHEFCYHESQNRLSHCSGNSVYSIEGTQLDISSTSIRSLIRQGKSIKYLLPATVEQYILQQRFYE